MGWTFIFEVNHQDRVTDFKSFEIHDIVPVGIDTKIKSTPYIQPEIRKAMQQNMCDLEFQGQPSRSREFFQHFGYP